MVNPDGMEKIRRASVNKDSSACFYYSELILNHYNEYRLYEYYTQKNSLHLMDVM